MLRLIDHEGLSATEGVWLADYLKLEGDPVEDRLATLLQLREGYGVTVVTGPRGAPFWSLASPEVVIRVEPDGYEYTDRMDERAWSFHMAGCSGAEITELLRREKPPTPRHRLYDRWQAATDYRAALGRLVPRVTLTSEDFPVERIDLAKAERILGSKERLALDWEWHEETEEPLGLAIATAQYSYYIPLRAQGFRVDNSTSTRLSELLDGRLLRGLPSVFHSGRSDLRSQFGQDPLDLCGRSAIDDTIIMAYLADQTATSLRLKSLTRRWLGREPVEYPGKLEELPVERVVRYAAADARNTYDLYQKLLPRLIDSEQYALYKELERPLMPIVASMEKYGQAVDVDELWEAWDEAADLETRIREAVLQSCGVDLAEDGQTRGFLREVLGVDPGSLDQRTLAAFDDGWVDVVLHFRQSRTRRRNFLGGHLARWDASRAEDYRIYTRFNQAASDRSGNDGVLRAPRTGRFSSANPNFQNQPRSIRQIFVAPPGQLFWSFDYSGLELSIAAALSKDPEMLGALQRGDDLHGLFQQKIADLSGVVVERPVAKAGNFEQLYGGRADKLRQILTKERVFLDYETANAIVQAHADTFPGYHKWSAEQIAEAQRVGYAVTPRGRRRYIPELTSDDPEVRSHAERAAGNHVIQGTAADIIKEAMLRLVPVLREYGAHLAMQVHDELCGWVPEDTNIGCFKHAVVAAMESVELPGLQLKVEGDVGKSWAEAH